MRHLIFSTLLSVLSLGSLFAQRVCPSHDILHQQMQENPFMQEVRDQIEQQTRDFIQNSGNTQNRVVVTIPVVVNVVWNTTAENVSDAQIQSQLDVLNADFRRLNADASNTPAAFQGISVDCEVNFCLATQDPTGAATTGIRRRQTTVTAFGTNDAVKYTAQGGLDIWDRSKYLNIWVCDISGGILGYAQFPGGPAATDGVVIDYQYFGTTGTATAPFNLGRTATHEVGHWLNLYHIWGDDNTSCTGSDQVADTPNQADENYGCPVFPQVSCSNGPNGDMFMNYMDYTDDACMNAFTAGQKSRAQALFVSGGARASLLTSPGCQPPSGGGGCAVPSGLSATGITQTAATLSWGAVSGATAYNLQWKLSSSSTWTTVSNLTGTSYSLSGLTANTTYNYQVQTVCGATSSSYSAAASFTTQSSSSCTDQYETNNTRNTAKVIPVNTNINMQIATSSDIDWLRFSNTSSTPRIKVDLTNLPFDYDLQLYRNTTLLGTSQNAGTTAEQLIANTTTVSTSYYARVYGYNGAFSNSQCYTLRVSLSSSNWRTDGSTDGDVVEGEIPVLFENAAFGIFPNPANNEVTIEVPMDADRDVQVRIVDGAGRVALEQNRVLGKGDNRIQFDLNRLANGMYFVQVRNGEQVSMRKLVVAH
ncbi:MAG: T9SS type A sorting domain-containing protein [Chitinophagales bacterium]|nr:T9SS type A sorting domain-containing protein [Chitinophagales bacterium]